MLSYTGRRQSFQDLTNASDTSTLALADRLMNQSEKRILTARDWPFLEKLDTSLVTVASQQAYNLPQRVSKPKSLYVVVSSFRYVPREITSPEEWDKLNVLTYNSDFPVYYYIYAGQILLWPTPASSSNVIGIRYRNTPKDITLADITSSTITSIANGGTAVVINSGGLQSMAGRFLQITDSNTALKGDGYWYEISATPAITGTTFSLVRPYAGTAIAAGAAACVIGQMSLLPEGYEDLSVFDVVRQYFATIQPDAGKFKIYDGMFNELMKQMIQDQGDKSSSPVLDAGIDSVSNLINPNLTVRF